MDLLNEEQMNEAVELFAQGKNRGEIAQHFIDTLEHLWEMDTQDPDTLRKKLSDALRYADPTSNKFAITKYKAHYDLHSEAMKTALAHKYNAIVNETLTLMDKQIHALETQVEELESMLDNAYDHDPKGTAEFLATTNMVTAKYKAINDISLKRLEIIERAVGTEEK